MLQYLTQDSDRFSIEEQCQMVIEGGCSWIQLHLPERNTEDFKSLCEELIPMCKEGGTILMLEDNPVLAKETGIHGVHLTLDSGFNPAYIREQLGPEAIVGVDVASSVAIITLRNADIDYVTLPRFLSLDECRNIIDEAADSGNRIPIVSLGDYDLGSCRKPLEVGFSGICTGRYIARADNPVAYTRDMLTLLSNP